MKITHKPVTIRELVESYQDNAELGIKGLGGKLDIRPAYQREFVYNDKQKQAVIDSIQRGLPLSILYWSANADEKFEVLDGQQRTLSICQYVNNEFSIKFKRFFNLTESERNQILDYELLVYVCEGTDKEKLDWFRTINIAGAKLTEQELRNATYTGTWLNDAKFIFSKTNCAAQNLSAEYVKGSPIRQEILETAIDWISEGNIEEYMSQHQHDENADELWQYFRRVINWAKSVFPTVRKEMAGVHWGRLYKEFGDKHFDAEDLEAKVVSLMKDEDVTKKAGIYPYLLTGHENFLNIRAFSPNMKTEAFTRQGGVCVCCGDTFTLKEMEADHITPWSKGGKTNADNCQMLCLKCNRTKSDK